MFRRSIRLFLSMAFAVPLLMAAVAGAPASAQGMADDSACLEEFLLGEAFGLCNAYCEAMDCDGTPPGLGQGVREGACKIHGRRRYGASLSGR